MKRKIVYIDLDDTICKFTGAWRKHREENPDVQWPQSKEGFFLGLEPIEGAIESVNRLREIADVYILTRPSYLNPFCYIEKRLWVEKHFDLEFCKNLIICSNKALLKGDILIDDVEWKDFEGFQILFGSNVFPDWKTVLKTVESLIKNS